MSMIPNLNIICFFQLVQIAQTYVGIVCKFFECSATSMAWSVRAHSCIFHYKVNSYLQIIISIDVRDSELTYHLTCSQLVQIAQTHVRMVCKSVQCSAASMAWSVRAHNYMFHHKVNSYLQNNLNMLMIPNLNIIGLFPSWFISLKHMLE